MPERDISPRYQCPGCQAADGLRSAGRRGTYRTLASCRYCGHIPQRNRA